MGEAYGEQARERIRRSLDAYAGLLAWSADVSWERAREHGRRHLPAIRRFEPRAAAMMAGIARGAELALEDVLALNVRTELLALTRALNPDGPPPLECSAVAVPGHCDGRDCLLIAQNWDWLPFARETIVRLETFPDQGPNAVTFVEAGLLAKFGLNANGVALVTNALMTVRDHESAGVPFHVLLRRALDSATAADARDALQNADRASSANYLVGSDERDAVNVETRPGGPESVCTRRLDGDALTHTNHFLDGPAADVEAALLAAPSSGQRLHELRARLDGRRRHTVEQVGAALADHANHPLSVCAHEDPAEPPLNRWTTVASTIMAPELGRIWLAPGHPCTTPYAVVESAAVSAARH